MKRYLKRTLMLAGGLACVLTLGGCGHLGVKPWEHDLMARDAMQWDADGVSGALDDHIYFSKEASSGGRSFGGGGCGCN
ncbi:MAG TPA: DUF4266 domain-containing protein [Aquabacterium sp.]|nr:DUF4266 domain-containing protein [Aquabacterium sp.]